MSEDRPQHPLDPLTADEVARAWSLVRAQDGLGPRVRVISIALAEPPRGALREPAAASHPAERAALVVLIDRDVSKTYEAVVSLTAGGCSSWAHVPGVQPAIMLDEFVECEEAVKRRPELAGGPAQARRRRTSSLVMVDPWSAGNYGTERRGQGRRLVARAVLGPLRARSTTATPGRSRASSPSST